MTKKLGVSFQVLEDRSQNKGFEEAGFVDIEEVNYKVSKHISFLVTFSSS